ncbi:MULTISPECIES: hypothetical protein [Mycolicibacterium]|jgi:hypothetical protein|uniref:Uncharacterized protein n=2 Tax=Mycolicibacterium TaxID=1866885 RepID=A0A378U704_MYCFO|nr:hypothetical protein [Mycolicibacterium fortuitum]MCV7142544.1 hypothetical protein [Mycolicibacterium fortuitum]MDV7195793.1 hypothetical protein [Mycolicibacterium fortuitum]MDV7209482.1 hypothetical protein [Mycolicibacterium fortuitum]MDV7231324.1 hypothetical protein [Mycolicibacterium fortuitum]MDV7262851.1 hypothetical protein [Mycolicibacterium fortuitum]
MVRILVDVIVEQCCEVPGLAPQSSIAAELGIGTELLSQRLRELETLGS